MREWARSTDRECDLIEAGLNEAAAMASDSKKFQSQWSSTVARLECAHNLDVTARMFYMGKVGFSPDVISKGYVR